MTVAAHQITVPEHSWRIDRGKALALAAVCWLGFAVLVWMVQMGRTVRIDSMGLMFWRHAPELTPRGPPLLLESVRDMTALGGVFLRHLIAVAAVVALLFLRLRREAVLLIATVVLGWVVNSAIKGLVGRARPEIVPHLTEAGGASFPSGHSFNAAVVYVAIALAFATLSRREPVRLTIIGAALLLSLAVAGSRVWLGVHFPSDVAAGWLGGVGWAFLAAALLQKPATAAADSRTAERLDPTTS